MTDTHLTSGRECKRTRFALWYSFMSAIFFIMQKLADTYCMSKLDLEHQVNILYERLIGKLWGGQVTKLQEGFQALHLLWSEVILPTPSQNSWRMTSTGRQNDESTIIVVCHKPCPFFVPADFLFTHKGGGTCRKMSNLYRKILWMLCEVCKEPQKEIMKIANHLSVVESQS